MLNFTRIYITNGNSMSIFVSYLICNYLKILLFGCSSYNLF